MASTLLVASTLYAPREMPGPVALVVRDGRVESVSSDLDALTTDNVIDLRPWRLAPGYIDLHTHGFAGHDVTSGSEANLAAMASGLPSTGVTAFYPTIASTGPAETLRQVQRIAASTTRSGAQMLGIRLEGPFINPAKKGAQNEKAIRPPDPDELGRLVAAGPVRIVDFAPELDSAGELLTALVRHGMVASIGHTAATYEQTKAAVDAGVRHCTHLFNAMPAFEHRAPGVVGALLTDTRATVEIIADGVHVHPAALRLTIAARGPEAVALVTDAMSASGQPDGTYDFVGRQVSVRDGAVRLADGTLAGSVLTMDRAVRNTVELVGATWSDAICMATLTPAKIAGIADHKGQLVPGADADLVVLDEAGNVRQTWRAGARVFESPRAS